MIREKLLRRALFIQAIRKFFIENGYLEVETPILSPHLIPEPSLEVFKTEYVRPCGSPQELYLIPSPELWMKRLIAQGSGSIFQITKSFRNCESISRIHNPEFYLLEWYTVGASYRESARTAEELFSYLLERINASAIGYDLSPPFLQMTMEDAFREYAHMELDRCLEIEAMIEEAEKRGVFVTPSSTWEEAFNTVFLTLVEPNLPSNKPLILCDYPAGIPTTAKRKPETPYLERWELYAGGIEIANCYSEETDPSEVSRFIASETERKLGCVVQHRIDTGFAEIFKHGFPACSGAALGVDRLHMIWSGASSIEGVIFFPLSGIV